MTFTELAQYFKKLEETPSRIEMTKILAELFKHASEDEIGEICYLLQGRVAPLYEATEFGIADKLTESKSIVVSSVILGPHGWPKGRVNAASRIKSKLTHVHNKRQQVDGHSAASTQLALE